MRKEKYETYVRGGYQQVICPFCEFHFECTKTPLQGTGKKCPKCGAVHRRGIAKLKEAKAV